MTTRVIINDVYLVLIKLWLINLLHSLKIYMRFSHRKNRSYLSLHRRINKFGIILARKYY